MVRGACLPSVGAGECCLVEVCAFCLHGPTRKEITCEEGENGLDQIIITASDLYTLKKRLAYLVAFAEYVTAKFRGTTLKKPDLNADFLDRTLIKAVKYVQSQNFGAAIDVLSKGSPDDFETFLKRRVNNVNSHNEKRQVNELKTLRNLRTCVGNDMLLRVDCRLENAELPTDTKHPLILPGRHPLTRLIILFEHVNCEHAGPSYTLMKTRQRYWIIHGIVNMKHFIADCGHCCLRKAKPIRQLMADLPECRVALCNKPFKFCGLDYLGPFHFRIGRSSCKA